MEHGAFALLERTIFNNIFKYLIFQRQQMAFMWSKWLNARMSVPGSNQFAHFALQLVLLSTHNVSLDLEIRKITSTKKSYLEACYTHSFLAATFEKLCKQFGPR